jgi:hypothetical protein
MHTIFSLENLKGRDHLKDNIITDLMDIKLEGVDWIHLAQDRDQWRDLVNMVTNFPVPLKAGNFLTTLNDY